MAQIIPHDEGIESALRRFKREVSIAELFQDMSKKRHFESPIEKKKWLCIKPVDESFGIDCKKSPKARQ